MTKYTCPCCGYRVFAGPPGTEEVCPICGWRDDLMHLRFPLFNGMPNGISLVDAQLNYGLIGAKDSKTAASVRAPHSGEDRDPDWRPLDMDVDALEEPPVDFVGLSEPDDVAALYYWLPGAG